MDIIKKKINSIGTSLLELVLVLVIASIAAGTIPKMMVSLTLNKAANKCAKEIKTIQGAARIYYIDNSSTWPANIGVLKSGNYLNSSWDALNPWSNAYTVSVAGSTFRVTTTVPVKWENAVKLDLPVTTGIGGEVNSSIAPPGAAAVSDVPIGAIMMWSGTIATIPSGWEFSDGTCTISCPDLRDRFIVGTRQDSGSVAMTNVTGSLTQSGDGQMPLHNHSFSGSTNTTGAHSHSYQHHPTWYFSGSSETGGKGGLQTYRTGSSGNHSHTVSGTIGYAGTGMLNVAVYYALTYIIYVGS